MHVANYGSISVRTGQGRFERKSRRQRIIDKLNSYGRHHGEPDSASNVMYLLKRIAVEDEMNRTTRVPTDATMELQLVPAA